MPDWYLEEVENRLPGASKVNSRRSTFEYILKPEVVAIGGRSCSNESQEHCRT